MAAETAALPSDDVLRRIEGGIAWITLNRPEAGNALTADMREQLVAWLEESSADLAVRVVVLTGAGRRPASGGRRPCRIPFPPPRSGPPPALRGPLTTPRARRRAAPACRW